LYGKPTYWAANGTQLTNGSNNGVRDLFSGERWIPDLGLYDLRNRYYSPDLGRFLQPDPIGFKGDASNLYRYCGNDWANRSDPMGLNDIKLQADKITQEQKDMIIDHVVEIIKEHPDAKGMEPAQLRTLATKCLQMAIRNAQAMAQHTAATKRPIASAGGRIGVNEHGMGGYLLKKGDSVDRVDGPEAEGPFDEHNAAVEPAAGVTDKRPVDMAHAHGPGHPNNEKKDFPNANGKNGNNPLRPGFISAIGNTSLAGRQTNPTTNIYIPGTKQSDFKRENNAITINDIGDENFFGH